MRRFLAVVAVAAVMLAMPMISLAGVPCSGTSLVWSDSCDASTGDTMYIYASVLDCYGSPLEGWVVNFYTDRGVNDVIIGNGPSTDPFGQAQARITSNIPGYSSLYAEVGDVTIGPGPCDIAWAQPQPVRSKTTVYYSNTDPGETAPPAPPWAKAPGGKVPLPGPGGSVWIGRINLTLLPLKVWTVTVAGALAPKIGLGSVHGYVNGPPVQEITSGCTGIKDFAGPPPRRVFTFEFRPQPDWEVAEFRRLRALTAPTDEIAALGATLEETIDVDSYSHCYFDTLLAHNQCGFDEAFFGIASEDTIRINEIRIFPLAVLVNPDGDHTLTSPPGGMSWTADVVYTDPDGNSRPYGGVRWTTASGGLEAEDRYDMSLEMIGNADHMYDLYAYDDEVGVYQYYRIVSPDTIGAGTSTGRTKVGFALHPNIPNPFSRTTAIRYDIPEALAVRLSVYDVSGRLVRELESGEVRQPGTYRVTWDGVDASGRNAAPGIYFCRFDAGAYSQTRRIVLIK